MQQVRGVGLLGILVCMVGCASVGVTRLEGEGATAKPANCHLDVYSDPSKISRPFREVCLIDAQTGTTLLADRTVAGAIAKARPAACQCGADAIIVAGSSTEGISLVGWGRGQATIKAVVYSDKP